MNKRPKYIVGLDPSGNFHEGKGTTGKCILQVGTNKIFRTAPISATTYLTEYEYWDAHLQFLKACLKEYKDDWVISIEDYLLYSNKADAQINSKFETVQLIGIIKMWAWQHGVPLYIRPASQVKTRWTNSILEFKRYIKANPHGRGWATCYQSASLSRHSMDAIRHAVHCAMFEIPKEDLDGIQ